MVDSNSQPDWSASSQVQTPGSTVSRGVGGGGNGIGESPDLAEGLVMVGDDRWAAELPGSLLTSPGFVTVAYNALAPLWLPRHDDDGFRKLIQAPPPS